jgi:plastocyanin
VPEIEIKQVGCRYIPHVIAVQAGVNFKITNGDPTLHNVRAQVAGDPGQPPGADVFNIGQPRQGQTDEEKFDTPGLYQLQCNVHGWMQAWVMALPVRAFGVSDTDGKFTIYQNAGAPIADGDYNDRCVASPLCGLAGADRPRQERHGDGELPVRRGEVVLGPLRKKISGPGGPGELGSVNFVVRGLDLKPAERKRGIALSCRA